MTIIVERHMGMVQLLKYVAWALLVWFVMIFFLFMAWNVLGNCMSGETLLAL